MKKLGMTMLSGIILSIGLLFGTSDAFAMGSKGDVSFRTNADVYSKSDKSIVVSGKVPHTRSVVELIGKDNGVYKRIDLTEAGSFQVSFSINDLKPGLYDVKVASEWGREYKNGELTNYIKVN